MLITINNMGYIIVISSNSIFTKDMVGMKYGLINQSATSEFFIIISAYSAKNNKNKPIAHPIVPTIKDSNILRSDVFPT